MDEEMEMDLNFTNACRICLQNSKYPKRMFNLFENKSATQLCTMIIACASIQIGEDDELPKNVCKKCIHKLNCAWQFKTMCELSDAKLRHYYNTQSSIAPSIQDFNNSCNKDQWKGDLPFNLGLIDDYPVDKHDDVAPVASTEAATSNDGNKRTSVQMHQCDTCGKTFHRKDYLTQHIRIHTGEKPYQCLICEQRFVNSGHLSRHMRTHTGEKKHACNTCPKTFSTRQELNKHTSVHNGDRPFHCRFCDKKFGSTSNLYSHLKHHTGEKNYACEQCAKEFYTKQELKQHLVVHTGEKAFECTDCCKKFAQLAHLKRHCKLHQQAERSTMSAD